MEKSSVFPEIGQVVVFEGNKLYVHVGQGFYVDDEGQEYYILDSPKMLTKNGKPLKMEVPPNVIRK
jgi:hypothetical protein